MVSQSLSTLEDHRLILTAIGFAPIYSQDFSASTSSQRMSQLTNLNAANVPSSNSAFLGPWETFAAMASAGLASMKPAVAASIVEKMEVRRGRRVAGTVLPFLGVFFEPFINVHKLLDVVGS